MTSATIRKNKGYWWVIASLAALVAVLGALGVFKQGLFKSGKTTGDIPGLRLRPAFSLERSDGKRITESDLAGKVVIVHFWAAWCAPCLPELPEVLAAAKKLPKDKDGKPILYLLVSQDDSFAKVNRVLKPESLPENVYSLLDPAAQVSDAFGTYQFPETYLVSREGGILTKWIGAQDWGGEWGMRVLQEVEELSRTGKVSAPATDHGPNGP